MVIHQCLAVLVTRPFGLSRKEDLGVVTYVSISLVLFYLSRHITDTPASEREFQENLHDLDHKINFINLQVCTWNMSCKASNAWADSVHVFR